MYRPSPVRNPRSKGIKSKNVLQVCLLLAVCFWLIFQVKRSHEKKKEFDNTKISLSTSKQSNDEIAKFGRKDLKPKLETEAEIHEEHQEHEEQDEQEHEEQDEEKIVEGKEDEIDENEQEKSEVEVDQEEIEEVIDEESQSQTETETETGVSVEDHEEEEEEEEENGASTHTHEGREEHYKADDASSAVVTHLATENATSEEISNGETVNNGTSLIDSHENGPPSMDSDSTEAVNVTGEGFAPNQTEGSSNSSYVKSHELNSSNEVESDEGEGESLEGNDVILDPDEVENETHLEEKEVRMDLDTLPEIETEGGNSEDTAAERR